MLKMHLRFFFISSFSVAYFCPIYIVILEMCSIPCIVSELTSATCYSSNVMASVKLIAFPCVLYIQFVSFVLLVTCIHLCMFNCATCHIT